MTKPDPKKNTGDPEPDLPSVRRLKKAYSLADNSTAFSFKHTTPSLKKNITTISRQEGDQNLTGSRLSKFFYDPDQNDETNKKLIQEEIRQQKLKIDKLKKNIFIAQDHKQITPELAEELQKDVDQLQADFQMFCDYSFSNRIVRFQFIEKIQQMTKQVNRASFDQGDKLKNTFITIMGKLQKEMNRIETKREQNMQKSDQQLYQNLTKTFMNQKLKNHLDKNNIDLPIIEQDHGNDDIFGYQFDKFYQNELQKRQIRFEKILRAKKVLTNKDLKNKNKNGKKQGIKQYFVLYAVLFAKKLYAFMETYIKAYQKYLITQKVPNILKNNDQALGQKIFQYARSLTFETPISKVKELIESAIPVPLPDVLKQLPQTISDMYNKRDKQLIFRQMMVMRELLNNYHEPFQILESIQKGAESLIGKGYKKKQIKQRNARMHITTTQCCTLAKDALSEGNEKGLEKGAENMAVKLAEMGKKFITESKNVNFEAISELVDEDVSGFLRLILYEEETLMLGNNLDNEQSLDKWIDYAFQAIPEDYKEYLEKKKQREEQENDFCSELPEQKSLLGENQGLNAKSVEFEEEDHENPQDGGIQNENRKENIQVAEGNLQIDSLVHHDLKRVNVGAENEKQAKQESNQQKEFKDSYQKKQQQAPSEQNGKCPTQNQKQCQICKKYQCVCESEGKEKDIQTVALLRFPRVARFMSYFRYTQYWQNTEATQCWQEQCGCEDCGTFNCCGKETKCEIF